MKLALLLVVVAVGVGLMAQQWKNRSAIGWGIAALALEFVLSQFLLVNWPADQHQVLAGEFGDIALTILVGGPVFLFFGLFMALLPRRISPTRQATGS